MITGRWLYRTRQFWFAVRSDPRLVDLENAATFLNLEQLILFQRMQPSEQAHSLRVQQALLERGEQDKDLFVAALLHDVGKTRYPLHLWERIWIVLAQAVYPSCVDRWGKAEHEQPETIAWWRKAFVVAAQHPKWGAEMAEASGTAPMAVALIRRHQEKHTSLIGWETASREEILLQTLQSVDDLN
jgi:putative nucleotidyltransferase with HDIG domain